ncbi:hypothetical protein QWY96_17895 [Vibrio artabrorum]|uniref:Arylsulfatase regulatory protein n=1 Tax=Vibrio artabrorum TaxID=446374 RepID=A0ABT8CN31_9VIBR|nr:hypothetical protein [Vibrio artabrorum]MDN3702312.1 hypothetical protein [Vibrio artabrorum]
MNQITNCHVMAKPSGSVCNIDCDYCFYLEKEKLYPDRQKNWRMDEETLEVFIQQYIDAQQGDTVQFAWQGESRHYSVWAFIAPYFNCANAIGVIKRFLTPFKPMGF